MIAFARAMLVATSWLLISLFVIWLPAWWLWNHLISPAFGLPVLSLAQSSGMLIYIWLAAKGAAKFKIEFDTKP